MTIFTNTLNPLSNNYSSPVSLEVGNKIPKDLFQGPKPFVPEITLISFNFKL